jgi:hypothetical protein
MNNLLLKAGQIMQRIVALFMTSALGIITGSSIINSVTDTDITIIQSAALAGFASVAQVAERLARSSLDGKLTAAEINEAFAGKPK